MVNKVLTIIIHKDLPSNSPWPPKPPSPRGARAWILPNGWRSWWTPQHMVVPWCLDDVPKWRDNEWKMKGKGRKNEWNMKEKWRKNERNMKGKWRETWRENQGNMRETWRENQGNMKGTSCENVGYGKKMYFLRKLGGKCAEYSLWYGSKLVQMVFENVQMLFEHVKNVIPPQAWRNCGNVWKLLTGKYRGKMDSASKVLGVFLAISARPWECSLKSMYWRGPCHIRKEILYSEGMVQRCSKNFANLMNKPEGSWRFIPPLRHGEPSLPLSAHFLVGCFDETVTFFPSPNN